jgi:hypothetical protein
MRRNWLLAIVVAGVLAGNASAQDGSIATYMDAAGTQCDGNIVNPVTIGSVWMNLAGATAAGITTVEFRIDNTNPTAYSVSFIADPAANAVIGNPFFGGINMAFPTCQTGTAGRVKLGDLLIQQNIPTQDVNLTVRQHTVPSNEAYPCALATQCDGMYTKVCLGPFNSDYWRSWINPTGGISGTCQPVAVEQATWSTVKSLYVH